MSIICHIPVKGIDDQIANKVTKVQKLQRKKGLFMYEMKEEYKIGVEQIDEQHKKLFEFSLNERNWVDFAY